MSSHEYISGDLDKSGEAHEHHVLPLSLYYKIFGALMVLTVVTVGVSYMGLDSASLYVAMFVAIIKAGLVIGYFMHLKYDDKLYSLVGVITLFFVLCFFGFTFADVATRDTLNPDWSNQALIESKIRHSSKKDCKAKKNCYDARQHNFLSQESHH
jgi:caa(3)-type oxidase subunit IV